MRIFLSHTSKDKPTVREVRKHFPDFFNPWLDERELLQGHPLKKQLEQAIKSECELVVLFLSNSALSSRWVAQEIEWALEAEQAQNRVILLPVLLDEIQPDKIQTIFGDRLWLPCFDTGEAELRILSEKLQEQIIKHAFGLLDNLRNKGMFSPLCAQHCNQAVKTELSKLLPHHSAKVQDCLYRLYGETLYIPKYSVEEIENIICGCARKEETDVGYGEDKNTLPFYIKMSRLTDQGNEQVQDKIINIMGGAIRSIWASEGYGRVKLAISTTESIKLNVLVSELLRCDTVFVEPIVGAINYGIKGGEVRSGDRVYYIHDVAVGGFTVEKSLTTLRRHGAEIDHVFCYVRCDMKNIKKQVDWTRIGAEIHSLLIVDDGFIQKC